MANVLLAYVLWLFSGLLGVHHFYLKRDRQAFVWWSTFGGFGLGWIRDFWRLPEYVNEANDEEYVDSTTNESSNGRERASNFSSFRFLGMVVYGYLLGYLALFAVPYDWFERRMMAGSNILYLLILPVTGVATGVCIVANIGQVKATFSKCLMGSAIGIPWLSTDPSNIGWSCLFSTFVAWWSAEVHRPNRGVRKGKCRRMSTLFVWGAAYLLLWGSCLYFNGTVTTEDGEKVPLSQVLHNFFKSPAWTETKEVLYEMWKHIRVHGIGDAWHRLLSTFDPQGEGNAYKVLGVKEGSSQDDIKKRYKQLAKEYHPDKQKGPARKEEAQRKFMEIQQAYETLSNIKSRRSQKASKSRRDEF